MVALIVLSPDMAHRVLRGDQTSSSDDHGFMSPKLSRRRERTFLLFQWNAKIWRTGVQVPALLLERKRQHANPRDSSQNVAVIAIARIYGIRRDSVGRETRPIEVSNWTLLAQPIPLHEITDRMFASSAENIWRLLDTPPTPLSNILSIELERALERFVPNYEQTIQDKRRKIQQDQPDDTETAMLGAERRDRHVTARRFFGERDFDDRMEAPAPARIPEHGQRLERALTEKAMLTDDSQWMPGWRPSGPSNGGWFEYLNAGRRLLIRDIDREREKESGSDLIYIRESPATVILVQYKRLMPRKG
jgi:hypothetical protein